MILVISEEESTILGIFSTPEKAIDAVDKHLAKAKVPSYVENVKRSIDPQLGGVDTTIEYDYELGGNMRHYTEQQFYTFYELKVDEAKEMLIV